MRRILAFLVVLALGGGAYYYVGLSRADLPEASYRTTKVERGSIIASVSATGTINPISTIIVGSQLSGLVTEILVDYNSAVKTGDLMVRLDATQVKAKLDAARADLAQAMAQRQVQEANVQKNAADTAKARALLADMTSQLARTEALMADATLTLGRQNELNARGVATGVPQLAAKTALETARAQRESANAQITSAKAAIESLAADLQVTKAQIGNAIALAQQKQAITRQVEVDLANTEIRSPVDGTVVQRSVELGMTVAASLSAPTLFQVAQDLREMEIYANVDESDVGRVQTGQPVTFNVNAYPGRSFDGALKLVRLGSQTVSNVVIYTAIVSVKNPKLELLPGMTANLRILTERKDNILRVANAALRWKPAGVPQEPAAAPVGGGLIPQTQVNTPPAGAGVVGQRLLAEFAEAVRAEVKPAPDQQKKIDDIVAAMRTQFGQTGGDADANARRERIRSLREQLSVQVAAVLSDEQKPQFEALRERLATNRQGAPGARNSASTLPGQPGRIFVLGADGKPEAVPIRTGSSDGSVTEIISGAIAEGREAITGGGAKPGGNAFSPPGGGRLF